MAEYELPLLKPGDKVVVNFTALHKRVGVVQEDGRIAYESETVEPIQESPVPIDKPVSMYRSYEDQVRCFEESLKLTKPGYWGSNHNCTTPINHLLDAGKAHQQICCCGHSFVIVEPNTAYECASCRRLHTFQWLVHDRFTFKKDDKVKVRGPNDRLLGYGVVEDDSSICLFDGELLDKLNEEETEVVAEVARRLVKDAIREHRYSMGSVISPTDRNELAQDISDQVVKLVVKFVGKGRWHEYVTHDND